MNDEVLSPATAAALEWPSLLALVSELAASDLGRARIAALAPYADDGDLAAARRRYEEADRLAAEGRLVPSFEQPLGELLDRLETGRPPLTGADLVRLGTLLRATGSAAKRVRAADPPCSELGELVAELPDLSELVREFDARLDRRGDVRDDASRELVSLRQRIRGVRDQLYRELTGFVSEQRDHLGEDTIPMRGGRLMVMLDSGARGRVQGLTHGRSGSGKSFYFEPLGVVEQNNSLQQATEDEEAERARILNELLAAARTHLDAIHQHADLLAELDLLEASRAFAELSGGRLADVAPRGELVLVRARHPLLDPRLGDLRRRALGQAGHVGDVVPLDLTLGDDSRALVVTGPNAGGKTVALKTVGLLTLAAQCALPVPAAKGSRLPQVAHLVATVGDEQDLLTDRSTFSGRLLRLEEAWKAAGPDSLILLDELGSGTDPEEGSALATALVEALVARHSLAVITTHLTQVAAAALELDGASCAAMEFDPAGGEPTFHLLPGPPGGSEALALARRLGLAEEWLDRAESLLGSGHRELQRLLTEVERLRGELAAEKERVRVEADDAEKLRRRLADEQRALAEERKDVGKKLRAQLDAFRRETLDKLRDEVKAMRGEMEAGRKKGVAAKAVGRLFEAAPEIEQVTPEPEGELEEGATVHHRGLGWEGTLVKLDRGRAEVDVRGKTFRCKADELIPVAGTEKPKQEKRKVTVDTADDGAPLELMLIGKRVEPALNELDDYLDHALLGSRPEVRVVHGHGSGALRDAVREHLRHHPAVANHRPGKRDEGGDGATVVTLRG